MAGRITLVFDDAKASVYHKAFPVLSQRGLNACIATPAGFIHGDIFGVHDVDRYCELRMLRELYAGGWEIACHGYHHAYPTAETWEANGLAAMQQLEYVESKRVMRSFGFDVRGYVYPGGGTLYASVAEQHYDWLRNSASGHNSLVPTEAERKSLKCIFADGWSWSAIQTYIDAVISQNRWGLVSFHGVDDGGAYSVPEATLVAIADYLVLKQQQSGLQVSTVSEGLGWAPTSLDYAPALGSFDFPVGEWGWYGDEYDPTWMLSPDGAHGFAKVTPTSQLSMTNANGVAGYGARLGAGGMERCIATVGVNAISLHVRVLSGSYRVRFVDYQRQPISGAQEVTLTATPWSDVQLLLPPSDPDDTYLRIEALSAGTLVIDSVTTLTVVEPPLELPLADVFVWQAVGGVLFGDAGVEGSALRVVPVAGALSSETTVVGAATKADDSQVLPLADAFVWTAVGGIVGYAIEMFGGAQRYMPYAPTLVSVDVCSGLRVVDVSRGSRLTDVAKGVKEVDVQC